ncbi:MAG: glycosyltransferase family 2 protein [Thermodesulfobacteriota bacterium]
MNRISVTILTKNSARHLAEVLDALKSFDEVILLDNGSTDNTLEIGLGFRNTVVYEHEFNGFGPMKNLAASYARNDWILSIDSDEICSAELVDEIKNIALDRSVLYIIPRQNYYQRELVRCCGWDHDMVKRLYHRQATCFSDLQVHESLIETGLQLQVLKNPMAHYSFEGVEGLIDKMQHYSSLYAIDHRGKKTATPAGALLRGIFAFLKYYFLQKGFLYGGKGLAIAVSNANGVFYKYMKLCELNKDDSP